MKRLSGLFLFVGLVLALQASAGEFKLEPGFTAIFNGKNFDGWQTRGKKDVLEGKTDAFKGRFKIADGIIKIDPAVKGDSYIETAKEFSGDVHLKFDFKAGPKCNNDFFLRGIKFDIVPGNKELKNVKEGEWYTMEIIVAGDKVEHKVNGESVRKSTAKGKSTSFMIRAEFGEIQVKNIRVKQGS